LKHPAPRNEIPKRKYFGKSKQEDWLGAMNKRGKDKESDMVSIDSENTSETLTHLSKFVLFVYYISLIFFIQNEEDKRLQEELLQAVDVLKVNKQTLAIDI